MNAKAVKYEVPPAEAASLVDQSGLAMATLIRESFAAVESQAEEISQYFYGALFVVAPETRDLFPVNMSTQRSRLLRALVYVVQMVDRPDELVTFLTQLGRDHRKFDVLGRHYDAVGTALLAALKRFLKDKWTFEVENAWTTAYGIIAKTMREAALADTGRPWWCATVIKHAKTTANVAVIRVRPDQPLPYKAGNYVSVEVPQRPRLWRYLSPANAPREDGYLEFHVRAVEGGWVSRAIVNHTKVGDVWRVGPAMGALTVQPAEKRKLLLIGGGTGLAPLVAIIDDLARWKHNPPVHLFYGGHRPEDLYGLEQLRMLAATSPWLTITPVTQEGTVNGGDRGSLATAVSQRGNWEDHNILVSGSPGMIRATVAKLLTIGVDLARISYDPFTLD
jgi:NAD(P)H-flavin reductase/hemoglobin-like flavoprotein